MVKSYTNVGVESLDIFWENPFYRRRTEDEQQRTTDARATTLALLIQSSRANQATR